MRKQSVPGKLLSAVLVLLCVSPFLYLFAGSFFDDAGHFTLQYYYQVFLAAPPVSDTVLEKHCHEPVHCRRADSVFCAGRLWLCKMPVPRKK